MPATTSAQMGKDSKAYKRAWDEPAKKFQACAGCKTPGYCKTNGCQSNQAAKLKKLEG
jgi:hypothetical protein